MRVTLAALFLLAGCQRVAEERARLDAQVGHAASDGIQVDVDDGLAVVRRLDATGLVLWAQAPALHVRVRFTAPPTAFVVTLDNTLVDTELTSSDVVAMPLSSARLTEKRWQLDGTTTDVALTLGPADADAPGPFRFAVLSDIQEAIVHVQDIFGRMNDDGELRFVIGAGDLTEFGQKGELERFQIEMERLEVPYYPTLGNHELGSGNPDLWPAVFGRSSLHFAFKGVGFSLIDSASATLDPLVYDELDDWLARELDRPHVVAMHVPPIDPIGGRNGAFASRDEADMLLGRLADAGVDLTLYGHIHSYYAYLNAGIPAYIAGGGGAIPEKLDGIGRHYLTIDVLGDTLAVAVVRID